MPSDEDYYEILGVQKDASQDEIKAAYRKMAKKYHPDVTTESKEVAEEKFKKVSEAYEVLSDEGKRKTYDQYGKAGVEGQFSNGGFSWDDFTHADDISDIFGDLFGGIFGGGRRQQPRSSAQAGESLVYNLGVELIDVLNGKTAEISFPHTVTCKDCRGTGGKDGNVTTCKQCNGQGRVQNVQRTPFGNMMSVSDCPSCGGRGKTFNERCPKCKGSGRYSATTKVEIKVPAGIEDGARIRVSGAGDAGYNGGPPGDLFVVVSVKENPMFQRDGQSIWTEVTTTYPRLVLGGTENIKTLEGDTIALTIPSGTQVGGVLRIPGKGLPKINSTARGYMYVRVRVDIPTKVSAAERELLEKLDSNASGGTTNKKGAKKSKLSQKLKDT